MFRRNTYSLFTARILLAIVSRRMFARRMHSFERPVLTSSQSNRMRSKYSISFRRVTSWAKFLSLAIYYQNVKEKKEVNGDKAVVTVSCIGLPDMNVLKTEIEISQSQFSKNADVYWIIWTHDILHFSLYTCTQSKSLPRMELLTQIARSF